MSEQGIAYRKLRSIEPESVFGQIKQNKGFRRFYLRGSAKIEIEFGVVAIAHNIQKLMVLIKKNGKDLKEIIVSIYNFIDMITLFQKMQFNHSKIK